MQGSDGIDHLDSKSKHIKTTLRTLHRSSLRNADLAITGTFLAGSDDCNSPYSEHVDDQISKSQKLPTSYW